MKRTLFPNKYEATAGLPSGLWFSRFGCGFLIILVATALSGLSVAQLFAAESATSGTSIEQRIHEFIPKLEDYVAAGMKAFDVPGVAIGILAGDKLIYSKGFGVRSKGGPAVDTATIFQIGSTAKGDEQSGPRLYNRHFQKLLSRERLSSRRFCVMYRLGPSCLLAFSG
jgi:Beta-lactamase